jgi:hypothetical protein
MKSVVSDSNYILIFENEKGTVDMKINKQNTKMESISQQSHLFNGGKSTKL